MKTLVRCLIVLVMLIVVPATVYSAAPAKPAAPVESAAPASSDTDVEVLHIFMCEMEEGTTEEQVDQIAQAKFKALRQMPGAEKAKMTILWPVAVSNAGEIDFSIVWTFPSFSDWGKFWDAYEDASPVAREDDITEGKVECPNSMVLEAHDIVAPK
jgi:hypothetical protein